jgi:hypothetical protein
MILEPRVPYTTGTVVRSPQVPFCFYQQLGTWFAWQTPPSQSTNRAYLNQAWNRVPAPCAGQNLRGHVICSNGCCTDVGYATEVPDGSGFKLQRICRSALHRSLTHLSWFCSLGLASSECQAFLGNLGTKTSNWHSHQRSLHCIIALLTIYNSIAMRSTHQRPRGLRLRLAMTPPTPSVPSKVTILYGSIEGEGLLASRSG